MANPGKALGTVRERAGRFSIRVTVATGKRVSVLLAWCSSLEIATVRAHDTQSMVDRLRGAGHADIVPKVLKAAKSPDASAFLAIGRAVDELLSGSLVKVAPKPDVLTFQAFAERWTSGALHREFPDFVRAKRTADDDVFRLTKHVYPVIGARALSSLTIDDALSVMRHLPDDLSSASRRHVAQLLSRVFAMAVYPCRILEASPLPRGFLPRIGKKKAKSALYPDEEARLLACVAVPLAHRMVYGYLAREGARTGEALALTWGDLDLVRGVVRLDENKTEDPRSWALDVGTLDALRRWAALTGSKPTARVFAPANPAQLADALREHLKAAGVTRAELFERSEARRPIRAHDLRATFVTVSLASGKPESFVTAKTGHKSSAEVNNYRRLAQTFADVGARAFASMADTIPELRAAIPAPPSGSHGGTDGGIKTSEKRPTSPKGPEKPRKTVKVRAVSAFDSAYRGSNPRAGTAKSYVGLEDKTSSVNEGPCPAMGPVMAGSGVPSVAPVEAPTTTVHALALALERASAAGRWDLVTLLARELEARRLEAAGNVVPLEARRRSDR
jgi:integrase